MYEWLRRLLVRPASGPARASAAPPPVTPAAPSAPAVPAAAAAPLPPAVDGGPDFEQRDFVNTAFNNWLFVQSQADRLDLNETETKVLQALGAAAQSGRSAADMLRRMPGLIPQLLQSLRSENFAGAEIARKISSDLVLVSAVIRLANSAIRQSGDMTSQIGSVEHAVIVIGQEGLRQLITTVAFRPIIDLNSGYYTKSLAPRIWDQSERSALACRMLAPEFNADPFEAFLTGLVQNAGLQTALRLMDQVAGDKRSLGSTMFCTRLMSLGRDISAGIAEEWRFPPTLVQAIREQGSMKRDVHLSRMGRVLALGDYLGKIKLLAEYGAISEGKGNLFDRLPLGAMPCYAALNAIS
ncbi:HDOD domain-containing protein [Pseudoduganella sp. RAF19]|uniref:HDOD domain-containing protein n=1 Tax=Pseudoduganella sp. RAF19 TaxID=3233052 RepID=UPI003F9B6700